MAPPGWSLAATLRVHEAVIHRIAWSRSASYFATCGADGRLVVSSAHSGRAVRVIRLPGEVLAASFSPDGTRIACSLVDGAERSVGSAFALDPEPMPRDLDEELGDYSISSEWDPDPEQEDGVTLPLRIFDCSTGELLASFLSPTGGGAAASVEWTPDGRKIVTSSESDGLTVWQARTGAAMHHVPEVYGDELALSPDGTAVCVVSGGGYDIVEIADGELVDDGSVEGDHLWSVAWSCQGYIALGGADGAVHIVRPGEPTERVLEGHSGGVTAVSFSHDGTILASKSLDGTVLLWDAEDWSVLSALEEPARGQSRLAGMRFSPVGDRLLTLGPAGKAVRLWDLDRVTIAARREVAETTHYSNAKVVLLGDQSVGKTGLGLVLAGESWRPTESTHRRNVWRIQSFEHEGNQPERRETFLWDLAGQPGYRLLHQLYLSDVAVAVVVFDARNEVDPFAGVRHWVRALKLAERSRQRVVPRLLIAARVDRGGPAVSDERLDKAMSDYGFSKYISTSAKEGWGIADLFEAIVSNISWGQMPKVSSTGLFDSIRSFLVAERDRGRLLMTMPDLVSDYLLTQDQPPDRVVDLRDEFETCVGRVAARGLIRRLSFGGMVLLRPEVLDAYAASLVNAVRDQPDGTGEISEDDARSGNFQMPADERVTDKQLERLLLTATVEEVLSHEVALREHSDEGPYLVFPTQSRREANSLEAPDQIYATIQFEGPVANVYATLVVRLAIVDSLPERPPIATPPCFGATKHLLARSCQDKTRRLARCGSSPSQPRALWLSGCSSITSCRTSGDAHCLTR